MSVTLTILSINPAPLVRGKPAAAKRSDCQASPLKFFAKPWVRLCPRQDAWRAELTKRVAQPTIEVRIHA